MNIVSSEIEAYAPQEYPAVWGLVETKLSRLFQSNLDERTHFNEKNAFLTAVSSNHLTSRMMESAASIADSFSDCVNWLQKNGGEDLKWDLDLANVFPWVTAKYGALGYNPSALYEYYIKKDSQSYNRGGGFLDLVKLGTALPEVAFNSPTINCMAIEVVKDLRSGNSDVQWVSEEAMWIDSIANDLITINANELKKQQGVVPSSNNQDQEKPKNEVEQFADRQRWQIARTFVESTYPKPTVNEEEAKEKEAKIASVAKRMVFLNSGTDVPAFIRLAYPDDTLSPIVSDELGSDTAKVFNTGQGVADTSPVSKFVKLITSKVFALRDEKLNMINDAVQPDAEQTIQSTPSTTQKGQVLKPNSLIDCIKAEIELGRVPYLNIANPPKTGIVPTALKQLVAKILAGEIKFEYKKEELVEGETQSKVVTVRPKLLIDEAQFRPTKDRAFSQAVKKAAVDGTVDYFFTPSKFLACPPFSGILLLSEDTYAAAVMQSQQLGDDPGTKTFLKRGMVSEQFTEDSGFVPSEFDPVLIAKVAAGVKKIKQQIVYNDLKPEDNPQLKAQTELVALLKTGVATINAAAERNQQEVVAETNTEKRSRGWKLEVVSDDVESESIVTINISLNNQTVDKSFAQRLKLFMLKPFIPDYDPHYNLCNEKIKLALARVFMFPNEVNSILQAKDNQGVLFRFAFSYDQLEYYQKHPERLQAAINDLPLKLAYFLDQQTPELYDNRQGVVAELGK